MPWHCAREASSLASSVMDNPSVLGAARTNCAASFSSRGYTMRAAIAPRQRASIASRRAFSRSGSPRAASSIAPRVPLDRSVASFSLS